MHTLPIRQRFTDRQAPALVEARAHGKEAIAVEALQIGVADVAQQVDAAVEIIGLDQRADKGARPPAQPADADEMRRVVAVGDHAVPDAQ